MRVLKRLASLAVVGCLAILPVNIANAAGGCALYTAYSDGQSLTAASLNSSFERVGQTNMIVTCMDDYSLDNTEMRLVTDPYPGGTESRATTLAGELERIRYVLKRLSGWSQWYTHSEGVVVPSRDIANTAVPVTNTVTETSVYSYTLAAGSYGNATTGYDNVITSKIVGTYLNNTGVGRDLTVKLYFGGGAVMTHTFSGVGASASEYTLVCEADIVGTGAATQVIFSRCTLGGAQTPGTAVADSVRQSGYNTATVAASGTAVVEYKITHSAADANLSYSNKAGLVRVTGD